MASISFKCVKNVINKNKLRTISEKTVKTGKTAVRCFSGPASIQVLFDDPYLQIIKIYLLYKGVLRKSASRVLLKVTDR